MLNGTIDKILNKLAIRYRDVLIKKKSVRSRMETDEDWHIKWAAKSAFEETRLEIPDKYDWLGFKEPDYSKIPEHYLHSLQHGSFAEIKVPHFTKAQLQRIQHTFTYGDNLDSKKPNNKQIIGFNALQESSYMRGAVAHLKSLLGTTIVALAIVIGGGIWGVHSYLKHQSDIKYWKQYNTPESYRGDGYTENFPCGNVKLTQLTSDSDLSSTEATCEYFGGSDHSQIDTYTVGVEHFLSNKYSPTQEMNCPSPYVYTGNPVTQTYYSETRNLDSGLQVVICGMGSSPTVARIQQGNTVYTLEAVPVNEKIEYAKLNQMIQGFQTVN